MTLNIIDSGPVAQRLRRDFRGAVHLPSGHRYDTARLPWNRAVEHRPAVVAEAIDREDVRIAVLAARDHDLPLAVQSTGHGAVRACDGGLLLRTSRMSAVRINPYRRTATTGPGAVWSDVIAAAGRYGLAPLSGTPSVGVAGYTLGGGTGWLSRRHGFAADSLVRAEVVTSAGTIVTADAEQNADLFWGLRGGGGNFGLVTSLEFRLYPVAQVYAGMSLYPIERAAETLARYRDWAPAEPDELTAAILLLRMPDRPQLPEPIRGRPVLGIRAFFLGRYEDAEPALEPLLAAAGPPLQDGFRSMGFQEAGLAIAGPPPPPTAFRQHIDLFDELSDDLIETLLDAAATGTTAIELRHWGGAMGRPAPDAGPVGHRDVPYSVTVTALYGDHKPQRNAEHTGGRNAGHTAGQNAEHTAPRNAERTAGRNPEHAAPRNGERTAGRNAGHPAPRNAEHTAGRNPEHGEHAVDLDAELDGLAARLAPHATGGSFLNFLTDPAKTATAYTAADLARLAEVKRAWDLENLFRLNHNISAAATP
jgi:FAD binding domain/Berberine and berberine like